MSDKGKNFAAFLISLVIFLTFVFYGTLLRGKRNAQFIEPPLSDWTLVSPNNVSRVDDNHLFKRIVWRNGKILLVTSLGSITMGLESFIVLGWNGLSLGQTLGMLQHSKVPGVTHPFALVLPHAIPEFLGFIIMASIGFRWLIELIAWVHQSHVRVAPLVKHLCLASTLAAILIAVSALIETFFSPWLAVQ